MPHQRLLVASATEDTAGQDRAFAAARRHLAAGDEVVLVGPSAPEGIARAAVHEDAVAVVVVGTEADVDAVRSALEALDAGDVTVESDRDRCDAPEEADRHSRG